MSGEKVVAYRNLTPSQLGQIAAQFPKGIGGRIITIYRKSKPPVYAFRAMLDGEVRVIRLDSKLNKNRLQAEDLRNQKVYIRKAS